MKIDRMLYLLPDSPQAPATSLSTKWLAMTARKSPADSGFEGALELAPERSRRILAAGWEGE